ncbi:unnamed protein product [Acanthoscelides obtectus]|uniref:Uncharacterized protein n=1 Tax=Acanthoscelides obtectus TaxID=200917 RepID=A0A9P0LPD3_ACAOB|nr:unnamed protein product [Acanthoscelides obtectus]CAK1647536.1 hypothetical protein AOBTE_LOCUS15255 [Acanthoscelides obtectus]
MQNVKNLKVHTLGSTAFDKSFSKKGNLSFGTVQCFEPAPNFHFSRICRQAVLRGRKNATSRGWLTTVNKVLLVMKKAHVFTPTGGCYCNQGCQHKTSLAC